MALDAALTAVTTTSVPTTLSIPGYVLIPTGARTFYVRSTGKNSYDPPALNNILTTVNGAHALCRASQNDTIICLPQHAETVAGTNIWSNTVASTRVVGVGNGTERPTFTFSGVAGNTFLLNDANNIYDNLIFLEPAATADVTVGFTLTGASNTVQNCYFRCSGAARKITTVWSVGVGADDFHFYNNQVIGGATAFTDTMIIVGVARPVIRGNYMSASLGTAEGLITCGTTASTDMLIYGNYLFNAVASSTVALKGMTAVTGFVDENFFGVALATVVNANGTSIPDASLSTPVNTPGNWFLGRKNYGAKPGLYALVCGSVTS